LEDEEEADINKVPFYDINWKDRTLGSMVQQFGLLLAQARRPRARILDYWQTDSCGPLRVLFKKQIQSTPDIVFISMLFSLKI